LQACIGVAGLALFIHRVSIVLPDWRDDNAGPGKE
jgi:hypothetical protein